jgi:hypothetical protein
MTNALELTRSERRKVRARPGPLQVLRIGSWVLGGADGSYVTGVFVSAALLIGAAVLVLLIAMRS